MDNLTTEIVKARKAGYNDDEIVAHLNKARPELNLQEALNQGWGGADIVHHLFRTENAAQLAGPPAEEDPGFFGTIGSALANAPTAFMNFATGHPIREIGQHGRALGAEAKAAAKRGDYSTAFGTGLASMIPGSGDEAMASGQEYGAEHPGAGTAHALMAIAPFLGPPALRATDEAVSANMPAIRTAGRGVRGGVSAAVKATPKALKAAAIPSGAAGLIGGPKAASTIGAIVAAPTIYRAMKAGAKEAMHPTVLPPPPGPVLPSFGWTPPPSPPAPSSPPTPSGAMGSSGWQVPPEAAPALPPPPSPAAMGSSGWQVPPEPVPVLPPPPGPAAMGSSGWQVPPPVPELAPVRPAPAAMGSVGWEVPKLVPPPIAKTPKGAMGTSGWAVPPAMTPPPDVPPPGAMGSSGWAVPETSSPAGFDVTSGGSAGKTLFTPEQAKALADAEMIRRKAAAEPQGGKLYSETRNPYSEAVSMIHAEGKRMAVGGKWPSEAGKPIHYSESAAEVFGKPANKMTADEIVRMHEFLKQHERLPEASDVAAGKFK